MLLLLLGLFVPFTFATVHHGYPSTTASFCDCVQAASLPGDECRLHTGTYYVSTRCVVNNVHGTSSSPIVVAAYGDGPVTIDGTVELSNTAWTKTVNGHYSTPSNGHDILQLFVDRELQVVARYPNAKWSDKSVFYAVENWFRSSVPG